MAHQLLYGRHGELEAKDYAARVAWCSEKGQVRLVNLKLKRHEKASEQRILSR